jgi:hypothetical protein
MTEDVRDTGIYGSFCDVNGILSFYNSQHVKHNGTLLIKVLFFIYALNA